MKHKKILIVFASLFLISSCHIINFRMRHYNHQYLSFAKKVDFSKGNWLVTPVSYTSVGYNEEFAERRLHTFLSSKLKDRLKTQYDAVDKNGKNVIPFEINFENAQENLTMIRKLTNFDFLISTKVYYLDDTDDIGVSKKHRAYNLKHSNYKSGCKVSFVVYDLKSEKSIFHLDYLGYIWIDKDDEVPVEIYERSRGASPKVMKRLLKKLK